MLRALLLNTLIGYYLVDSLARILNLRGLKTHLPGEFADIYDESRYRRSQEYTKSNTRFELLQETCSLAALLIFWFAGGFDALDRWVRQFGLTNIVAGLLYVSILCIAREAISLPFEVYHTYVIEQRFGFNRMEMKTFILDRLKGWLLSGLLLCLFSFIVLTLFTFFGKSAWIVAWACTATLSSLLMYLAPTLILPLFFKFSPLPEGALRDELTALCARQRFPVKELLVIDGSRRSSKANAFFTGFGSNKRIALYDTLIVNHTVPELLAVLAHEIGHFKRNHIIQHFIFGQLNLLLLFFAASLCVDRPEIFAAFGVTTPSLYVGLALFLILVRPAAVLIGVAANYFSRRHEFEADRFAAEAMGDPNPLIQALKRLSKDSLSNLTPHPLLVALRFTHPSILARVLALRKTEKPVPSVSESAVISETGH
jgi:STE24 endopeptidase